MARTLFNQMMRLWLRITIIGDNRNLPVERRNSVDVGRACHVGARVQVPLRGDLWGLFLALQHFRLCISRGSQDHVNGGAVSQTLNGMLKNHRGRQASWQ